MQNGPGESSRPWGLMGEIISGARQRSARLSVSRQPFASAYFLGVLAGVSAPAAVLLLLELPNPEMRHEIAKPGFQ